MSASPEQLEKLRLTSKTESLTLQYFGALMTAAKDDSVQQQKIVGAKIRAQINAADAALHILQGNEPGVQSLIASLQATQENLTDALTHLENIVATVDLLVSVVKLGTRLVAIP